MHMDKRIIDRIPLCKIKVRLKIIAISFCILLSIVFLLLISYILLEFFECGAQINLSAG